MSRRVRILVVTLTSMCIVASFLYPRVRRSLKYADFVAQPRTAVRLSVMPKQIQISAPNDTELISTRWATFSVPADVLSSMTAHWTWLKIEGHAGASVLLTELHYETQFTSDGNYTFEVAAANALPATTVEVFLMSQDKFDAHLKLITAKFANPFRDCGVSSFQTDHVKGMIYHGKSDGRDDIEIRLWHATQPVSEIVIVSCPDHALRELIAQSIAASFKFTVHSVPDHDELLQFAKDSAETFKAPG